MKAAVIGCGNISRLHFKALKEIPGVEIVGAVDIKPERADAKASEYGTKAYYDIDELFENEKVDTVHICTPHYLHTPMAIKAMQNGANVLIEKPCSVLREEIKLLQKAQTDSGKQVAVCFQNRYNSCVQYVKNIIDSGEMGKVTAIRAFVTWARGEDYYSDDWHGTAEKECGGVLINQAIHTVDLIQYLGGKCRKVTAHVSNDHLKGVIEVEDNASVIMELEGGIKAVLYATTAYAENSDVIVEVTLEGGKMRIEGEKFYLFENDAFVCRDCGGASEFIGQKYWGAGHSSLINDFYECLETGRKFRIDAFEGGRAAEIVAASYESSSSGESVSLV